jgi:hypothetical protein
MDGGASLVNAKWARRNCDWTLNFTTSSGLFDARMPRVKEEGVKKHMLQSLATLALLLMLRHLGLAQSLADALHTVAALAQLKEGQPGMDRNRGRTRERQTRVLNMVLRGQFEPNAQKKYRRLSSFRFLNVPLGSLRFLKIP